MKKIIISALLTLSGVVLLSINIYGANPGPLIHRKEMPRHVPGKLSVRYKSAVAKDAPDIFLKSSTLKKELKKIHTKYGFKGIKRAFSNLEKMGSMKGKAVLSAQEMGQITVSNFPGRFERREESLKKKSKIDVVTPPLEDFYVLDFGENVDMETVAEEYRRDPDVISAEPMYLWTVNSANTIKSEPDPLINQQSSLDIHRFKEAWSISTGEGIVVAVVDTGVDCAHEDMTGQCLPGYDFVDIPTSSYTNDDFTLDPLEDYTTPDDSPTDREGHGTHVAGIIAAVKDNGIGITGTAPGAKILPMRAGFRIYDDLEKRWTGLFEPDDIANAIIAAADRGADIINMSFGSSKEDELISAALEYARGLGVILVAAAGNDSADASNYFPAAYNFVITVAATDASNSRTYYSNHGDAVDIAARGSSVLSLLSQLSDRDKIDANKIVNNNYLYASGTSMASPIVAGAVALMVSEHSDWNTKQIRNALRESARVFGQEGLPQPDYYIGTGLLDAYAAVQVLKSTNNEAVIHSPESNAIFQEGSFDINVTALGSEFVLSYGLGVYPTKWMELARGGTANNEVVKTVNVKNLPLGEGRLKLTVIDNNGQSSDSVGLVYIVSGLIELKASYNLDSQHTVPLVMDFDNDGDKEILLTLAVSSGLYSNIRQFILLMERDGSTREILNYGGGTSKIGPDIEPFMPPAAADLDNDNQLEIVVGLRAESVITRERLDRMVAIHHDGSIVWDMQFPNIYGSSIESGASLGDIDADGFKEAVFSTDSSLVVLNHDGSEKFHIPISGIRGRHPPSLVNLDNDKGGQLQILVRVDEGDHDSIRAYDSTGTLIWSHQLSANSRIFSPVTLGDLDGNGLTEIVYVVRIENGSYIEVLNADGVVRFNTYDTQLFLNPISSPAVVGDVNQDGILDMVVVDWDGNLQVFTDGGALLWHMQIPSYATTLTIADINNDGNMDIVGGGLNVAELQSNEESTRLFAVTNPGEIKWLYQIPGQANPFVINDFDDDGLLELIIMPNHYPSTELRVYQLGPTGGKMYWPEYQQNPARTGLYQREYPDLVSFLRGDANNSGAVDIADAIYILNALFVNTSLTFACTDAADTNDDSKIDISDGVNLLNFLFTGRGIVTPNPFTMPPATDTTLDNLTCASYILSQPAGGAPH